MIKTAIRCTLLTICSMTLAARLTAAETSERSTPLADRLESIRRNIVGEGSDNATSPRKPATRSSASRGERTTPQRSRHAAVEESDNSSEAAPAKTTRRVQPEPEAAEPIENNDSSRRRSALVEQPAAAPAQSSRRRAAVAPTPEKTEEAREANVEPTPAEHKTTAAPPASKPAKASTAESDANGVLFARKGPLLRTETVGPQTTILGKPATYKVRVQNMGEVSAEGVLVQIQLPDWAEVVATQPTRGTVHPPEKNQGGSTVQWQLASLDGRGIDELDLQLVMRRSQRFNLGVSWTAAPSTSETAIDVLEPKLELAISGPRDVQFGDTKTYRLTISNPGTGDAEQVGIQLMPIDGGTQPAASQTIGTIAAGQSKVLEIELTARRAGTIKINATATADNGLKSEAVEEVLVRRAGLKIDVTSPPMKYAGTPCNYTIQVTNPGDATAQKLSIEATLPSGAQNAEPSAGGTVSSDGTKVTWKLDTLAPGQQQVLQVSTMLQTAGANQLRVTAEAAGDLAETGSATTNVEALADLKLEVSDPSGPVAVGDEAVYEIRIRNRGTTSANGVETVGFFSEGLEPTRANGGNGRVGAGQVVFEPIKSLAAGSEVVLKISAKATKPGNHVFRAEVRCRTLGTQLIGEETTLFYQSGATEAAAHTAERAPKPASRYGDVKPISR
ncbi:MAG: DUF11 domain-containing protein [Planctomycetes bacterium]|nr:DUF11 domain-containing protein [Planctomycetota bacterium]